MQLIDASTAVDLRGPLLCVAQPVAALLVE